MFNSYEDLKFEVFQILNEEGEIINPKQLPKIDNEILIRAYKFMCLSRKQEEIQFKISDGGKNLNFLPSTGQEATEVGYAIHLRKGKDWFVPAYRNNAAWITAGYPIESIYLYWLGNEIGSKVPDDINVLPVNIPIGTQYSHAAGIAFAEKYKKGDGVVITTIGDGGTSEGEVYEAMNFAGIHQLPVIFMIENNQWSLTTPRTKATFAKTLAQKGIAVGIPSAQVDGNDFLAVYTMVQKAIENAKAGKGPTVIEAITYRRMAHSASDIKGDYVIGDYLKIEEQWLKKDPIDRLKKYLIKLKIWDSKKQSQLDEEHTNLVNNEIKKAISKKDVALEDIFKYTYSEMTPQLKEQLLEAQEYFTKFPPKEDIK